MLVIMNRRSDKNWISFSAGKHTSRAIRQKNGEITTETIDGIKPLSSWSSLHLNNVANFLLNIFSCFVVYLLPLLKGFWINPMIKNHQISSNYYLISVPFLILLCIISISILIIKDKNKSLRKNHGAEHKVFAAYNDLKCIPTVNQAKYYSRICKTCSITIYSALITAQLIGFLVYHISGAMIPEILLFLVPLLLLHSTFPFNVLGKWAQFFTTAEPDDDNLELAIEALTELVRTEEPLYFFIQAVKKRIH